MSSVQRTGYSQNPAVASNVNMDIQPIAEGENPAISHIDIQPIEEGENPAVVNMDTQRIEGENPAVTRNINMDTQPIAEGENPAVLRNMEIRSIIEEHRAPILDKKDAKIFFHVNKSSIKKKLKELTLGDVLNCLDENENKNKAKILAFRGRSRLPGKMGTIQLFTHFHVAVYVGKDSSGDHCIVHHYYDKECGKITVNKIKLKDVYEDKNWPCTICDDMPYFRSYEQNKVIQRAECVGELKYLNETNFTCWCRFGVKEELQIPLSVKENLKESTVGNILNYLNKNDCKGSILVFQGKSESSNCCFKPKKSIMPKYNYAVYIGRDPEMGYHCIVHYGEKKVIEKSSLLKVYNDMTWPCTIYNDFGNHEPLAPDEIVQRAEILAEYENKRYNPIKNNCQHFANWCRYGEHYSEQVYQIRKDTRKKVLCCILLILILL